MLTVKQLETVFGLGWYGALYAALPLPDRVPDLAALLETRGLDFFVLPRGDEEGKLVVFTSQRVPREADEMLEPDGRGQFRGDGRRRVLEMILARVKAAPDLPFCMSRRWAERLARLQGVPVEAIGSRGGA